MRFFNKFPLVAYDLEDNNQLSLLTDFFHYVAKDDDRIAPLLNYEQYNILDGQRPDNVSFNLYGNEAYHWTFFILNDRLKKGISSWPLSYYQWRQWVTDNYEDKVVLTFFPEFTSTPVTVIGSTTYLNLVNNDNYLSGIDFTQANLKLQGVTTGITSKVLTYDMNTLQAWCVDLDGNPQDFSTDTSYRLLYTETDKDTRVDFLLSMIEYFRLNKQAEYRTFNYEIDLNEIIPLSDDYFDYFQTNFLDNLTFSVYDNRSYYPAWEAPKKFIDPETDTEISHLDGLDALSTNFQNHFDYEDEQRFEDQRINVISPQYIGEFSREFKRLIGDVQSIS
jgi:hypothetical protein